jgi:F0F1-type ATP synthase membrane subunit b/b'
VNIGQQLIALLWQAVPTVILISLLYFFLRANLIRPLEKVLDERAARIEGARKESEGAHIAAQEKLRAYHDAQKKVRAEIYAEQEAARRAALEARAARIREARNAAAERVAEAKSRIEAELDVARMEIDSQSEALAGEVVRAILERRPPARPGAGSAS